MFSTGMGMSMNEVLSSLSNLVRLSHQSLPPPPQALNASLMECPFDPNHLVPPHSLFLHHLTCPSSPRPLPDPNHLLLSLSYPKTLLFNHNHNNNNESGGSNQPSFSLDHYLDFASNFFYRDCPAVVTFSDADSINKTFTLPAILSFECANFSRDSDSDSDSDRGIKNFERAHAPILPSQYWAITTEVEAWNDYPTSYSYAVLRAILGLAISKERDLMRWIMANSPRYGPVIDTAMQQHIFLLFCLCFKSILREAFISLDALMNKQNPESERFLCPILVQALTWLASQVSILYGATNGKLFVFNFFKKCILDAASGLLLFPLGEYVAVAPTLKQESQNSDTKSVDVKDAKPPDTQYEQSTNCVQNCIAHGTVWSRKIFVYQVAAAVAALHERSLLEDRIKGLWFPQPPSKYQLVSEHCSISERANEERKKRPDYRPLIDHDGFHQQQSSHQETSREKTREELLAEERDYKRRRMSYRGKKIKSSSVQVMRDMIEEYMEEIKQAGGVESPLKVSEESGLFPSKPPSGHDTPIETNNSRKINHDSPAVTVSNPSYYEQHTRTNYRHKSKAVEDAFSRDYEQRRQGHYRNHDYVEDQWDTGQGKYRRESASTSPERHRSHSRSYERSIHHKKQDYSNKKKYDQLSRNRDRWQTDTHRNHMSDSFPNNAFEDRYDPSESLDVGEDDISSDAKYFKPDKSYDKELH